MDSNLFHKMADVLHAAAGKKTAKYATAALIVAAGSSTRMGDAGSKQLQLICGKPLIVHTLLAFENAQNISDIIVAAKEEEIPLYAEFAEKYHITKFRQAVPGGKTRQESVEHAFRSLPEKTRYVAVADGARCLVTPGDIDLVCSEAYVWGAATAACPAVDTIKVANASGFIESTPDRSKLWSAQTPQVFREDLFRTALYFAKESHFTGTDDNSLVENIKGHIKLVKTDGSNIKITYPSDLLFAEAVLSSRQPAPPSSPT